jgi:hypothetical protein
MKIRLDIDCTPEEARAFFGLPDVRPMQARMMEMIQERIEKGLAGDPETLLKTWMPAGVQGWDAMQKMFWTQAGMGESGKKKG